ncbi:hypothetical protein [Variovorax rhizosphaerae]|uniref:Uncharacterized protein n=1 Tax=Variovorax rhizosphaerae TaxID=1836200 RepID=A0ABU8X058_9BURK
MTEASRNQFEEAYLLWAGAIETHKVMMDDAMVGKTVDVDQMHQLLAEIEDLHQDWMRKSTSFVHWK